MLAVVIHTGDFQAYRPQGVSNHKDILLTYAGVKQFSILKCMNMVIVQLQKQF